MLKPSGGVLKKIFNPGNKSTGADKPDKSGGLFGRMTNMFSKTKKAPSSSTPTAKSRFGSKAMGMKERMQNRKMEREY